MSRYSEEVEFFLLFHYDKSRLFLRTSPQILVETA